MILRTVLQCYGIDCEMFVGDQRYTEKFIEKFIQDFTDLTFKINADRSAFCFGCICRKKNNRQKIGPTDAVVDYDEDDSRKNIPLLIPLST